MASLVFRFPLEAHDIGLITVRVPNGVDPDEYEACLHKLGMKDVDDGPA